jgi:PEGA domain.
MYVPHFPLKASPHVFIAALLIFTACIAVPCAAAPRVAMIGDSINLNGSVMLVDTVYLFVTGPGMPPGGARMDNSNAAVVTGDPMTFTQVPVVNDRWEYIWNTGRVSGGLAPGLCTVYVSTEPVSARDLSGVKYADIEIMLEKAVTTGSIDVTTEPSDAQVSLDGKFMGFSPLTIPGLSPGAYDVSVALDGYIPQNGPVDVVAGKTALFSKTLQPNATPVTTTVPATPVTPASPSQTGTPLPAPTEIPVSWGLAGIPFAFWISRKYWK